MAMGTNYGNAANAIEFVPRTDTSEQWNRQNPVLAAGEMGRDSSLNRIKFGDGRTRWRDLPYATGDGRAGLRGQPGPKGADGASVRYVHTQSSPMAQWTINHNLGVRPAAVSVLSVGGVEVNAAVTHVSVNQLVISFAVPFAGTAVIL